VARVKQTARSEARRRHRLANRLDEEATPNELDADGTPAEGPPAGPSPAGRSSGAAQPSAPSRPGVLTAFRSAYHPARIREDLRDLPNLLRTTAFLGGAGLMLAGAAIFIAFPAYSVPQILFQYLVYPPAFAPIFFVGFFAKRASYLIGFIFGLLDAIVFIALLATGALDGLFGKPFDPALLPSAAISALFAGAGTGTVFAAAFAWYRRFLSLSSPKRAGAGGNRGGGRGATRAKSASRR
jgi:hypothetical protein